MEALYKFLYFFSPEALDSRFSPTSESKRRINNVEKKSRWNTLEFKCYYVVFIVVVPMMFRAAMTSSNEDNPNFIRFSHLLSDGWMFGRKVDNSDKQYSFFRDNFLLLCAMGALHLSARSLMTSVFNWSDRTMFDFGYGIFFLGALHGKNIVRILAHLLVIYAIGKFVPSIRLAYWLTWVYGILSLFINDRYKSISLGTDLLDKGFKGIIPRWDVFFNFTLLKILSFNFDYLEKKSLAENTDLGHEKHSTALSDLNERQRLEAPLPLPDYNFINYIAYTTYAPLYVAGPIITFNDYLYQSKYEQLPSTKSFKRTSIYVLRMLFCMLTMEFLLHYTYVVAASKTKSWAGNTPFQVSMFGMFNLNIIWLKLLIPWRMFRLWSLIDGIDPPENMIRCMDNNYSALAFWRAWHRSYNKWIIRYIYVPLGGGGKYRILNSLLVFSFVAIWHDIELRLLMWGWLVVVFLLPELLITMYFKRYKGEWWYRHLCALGGSINIWLMMMANLFGFCLNKDELSVLLLDILGTFSGICYFLLSISALFVGVQVMFELRESEKRRGIDLRC